MALHSGCLSSLGIDLGPRLMGPSMNLHQPRQLTALSKTVLTLPDAYQRVRMYPSASQCTVDGQNSDTLLLGIRAQIRKIGLTMDIAYVSIGNLLGSIHSSRGPRPAGPPDQQDVQSFKSSASTLIATDRLNHQATLICDLVTATKNKKAKSPS